MDLSGLSPVIIRAWLPKDALPQASDEADEAARKPLETLLELIPERLRQSGPFAKIKALTAVIADNHAKLAAGEVTEEDCDRKAEEDLAPALAAYDELATAMCKSPHATAGWVNALIAYNTAGVTTIVPGGALNAVDCFGANSNPLAATSKALAVFVAHVALEKTECTVVPRYMPNVFSGKSAAEGAAEWVDMQCALLGVEMLDHVIMCWWDDAVEGVVECIKALKATEKVGKVSLGGKAGSASLIAAHAAGETPASVSLPALAALTAHGAVLVAACKLLGVPVVASDVLLGGLVSSAYLGRPAPNRAGLAGTAAFQSLGCILETAGGWERFQGLLGALSATGRGVETAMVQVFIDAGMHAEVDADLTGPPSFTLGGAALSAEHTAAIIAAMV